jgi:hypothetical protein
MGASRFINATISTGTYNAGDYSSKEYRTLAGFKRGLKAKNCPFEVDGDGLFAYIDGGRLGRRQWNYAGKQFTASVLCE